MKERNAKIVKKDSPILLDKVIQDMQETLAAKLEWLNYAFGKAYKLVDYMSDGSKFIYPAAYIGNSEYISLLPNDNLGNFCWFDIYDPQEISAVTRESTQLSFTGAIVFWFNLNTIFADSEAMYAEELKDDILKVLRAPGFIKGQGKITITEIYEKFDNIYKGFVLERIYDIYSYKGQGLQAIDKQFFMHPYYGLRFEFNLITRELC